MTTISLTLTELDIWAIQQLCMEFTAKQRISKSNYDTIVVNLSNRILRAKEVAENLENLREKEKPSRGTQNPVTANPTPKT